MAYLRMNQVPSGGNARWTQGSTLRPPQRQGGLGALGDSKSRWYAWAAMASAEHQKKALVTVRDLQAKMEGDMAEIRKLAQSAQDAAYELGSANVDDRSFALVERAQDATSEIQSFADEARNAVSAFESEFDAARAKGGDYLATHEGPGPLVGKASATVAQLKTLSERAKRSAGTIQQAIVRIKGAATEKAQAAAQQAAAVKQQEAIQQQVLAQKEVAETKQQQAKFDYEKWQAEREFAMQKQLMDAQQAKEDAALRREQEALAREEARAQAEIDREESRRRSIEAAEARKIALEEERILREEERILRREQREAELEKLMLMQELAAKGMPIGLPGVQAVPPPQAVPGAVPAGFIPPGFVQAPAYAPSPGYAAQAPAYGPEAPGGLPPTYQQGGVLPGAFQQAVAPGAPGAPAPAGMQWASFDPASEMFGMGDLKPMANQDFTGGFLEEGYSITGPDSRGEYTIRRKNGQTIGAPLSADALTHSLQDQGKVVYVPPPNVSSVGSSSSSQTEQNVFDTIQSAIRGTADVLAAREARKAARYAGQAYPTAFQPPMALTTAPARSWVGPVLAGGAALALGIVAYKAISRKK